MNYTKLGILGAVLFTLTACGGSSSDGSGSKSSTSSSVGSNLSSDASSSTSSSSTPATDGSLTGVFIDSAVANVTYKTAPGGKSGTTSANGEYDYLEGDTVTFSIGALVFPTVAAKGVVTPMDMANSDAASPIAVNIAALLQSLDADGNPDNGIDIPAKAAETASEIDFDQPYSSFASLPAVVNLVANSGSTNTALVSEAKAKAHLEKSLNDIQAASLIGTWHAIWDNDGSEAHYLVFFLSDNSYGIIDYDPTGDLGIIEYGFYNWSPATGELSAEIEFRTNDEETSVLLQANKLVLNNDQITFTGTEEPFTLDRLKPSATSPIAGGWAIEDDDAAVLVAFTNNLYFMGQVSPADEVGESGVEGGSYTYNLDTKEVRFTTEYDNNGQWGFSHPCAVLDLQAKNDLSCGPDGAAILQTFTADGDTATFISQADTIAEGEEHPFEFNRVARVIDGSIRLNLIITLEVTEYNAGERFVITDDFENEIASLQCGMDDDTEVGSTEEETEVWYLYRDKPSKLNSIPATFNPQTNKITYTGSSSWEPTSCGDENGDGQDDCENVFKDRYTETLDLTYHPGQTPVITGTYKEDRELGWTLNNSVSKCGATYSVSAELR